MARMRTVKPGFFTSEGIAPGLPFRTRLFFVGLWTYCDDHGRGKDNVRLIKGDVWPLDDDVTLDVIDRDLDALVRSGHVVRYEHGGIRYLAVQNWHFHQKPNHPTATKIPAPPEPIAVPAPKESGHCASCWSVHVGLTEDSGSPNGSIRVGGEGRGGEKEGRNPTPPPSPRCPQHVDNSNPPPCGRCKEARIARERWDTDEAKRAKETMLTARRCGLCDADGWRLSPGSRIPVSPYERCDHRPLRSVG